MTLLGALVGTALGWAVGILLALYPEEQKRFQRLSKGIAGLLIDVNNLAQRLGNADSPGANVGNANPEFVFLTFRSIHTGLFPHDPVRARLRFCTGKPRKGIPKASPFPHILQVVL